MGLGHIQKFCTKVSRVQPKFWKPKAFLSQAQPTISWKPRDDIRETAVDQSVDLIRPLIRVPSPVLHNLEHNEQYTSTVNPVSPPSPPAEAQHPAAAMANFEVNPTPYVPMGMDIEQWARPARGRMVISGHPPRRHEQYAIITLTPAP